MKRLQKYVAIFGTAMLCVGFSACSKQSDFDAQSYIQSSLDAEYYREYADYANLMEISEEDAKKQVEEDFNESIRQLLPITSQKRRLQPTQRRWQK